MADKSLWDDFPVHYYVWQDGVEEYNNLKSENAQLKKEIEVWKAIDKGTQKALTKHVEKLALCVEALERIEKCAIMSETAQMLSRAALEQIKE